MNALKLAAIALATTIGSAYTSAQETVDVMQLTLKNNIVVSHNVADIDSISLGYQTIAPATTIVDGYECVDLGLPSGLLWATCNVGAAHPTDLGGYFAWGATEQSTLFSPDTTPTYNVESSNLDQQGIIDSAGNLMPRYDVATSTWGQAWRMPTQAEIEELVANCSWEWGTPQGRFGCTVTGPNGNSIFLPAGGWRDYASFKETIYYGYYLSSTVYGGTKYAYCLYFNNSEHALSRVYRYFGCNVRPVTPKVTEQ